MKLKITRDTNICGKFVRSGAVVDASFIAPNIVRTLINCGAAVEFIAAASGYGAKVSPATDNNGVELADNKPATETANLAPKSAKKPARKARARK